MTKIYTLTHEELAKILAKHFGVNSQQTYWITYNPILEEKSPLFAGKHVVGIKGINITVKDG